MCDIDLICLYILNNDYGIQIFLLNMFYVLSVFIHNSIYNLSKDIIHLRLLSACEI